MIEWRPLPGYPGYLVSSTGRIASLPKAKRGWRIVLKSKYVRGYLAHEVMDKNGRRKAFLAHRAVALAFHGEPPTRGKMDASPQDGNRKHISPTNVRWQTRTETMRAKHKWGTQPLHEKHHWSKLTMAKADAIRRAVSRDEPRAVIAEQYGVSRKTIWRIISKQAHGGWNPAHATFHRNVSEVAS